MLALGQGLFDWYSKKSAGPVGGFLGGNVLNRFRLEIDWSQDMTWWEPGPAPDRRDLDMGRMAARLGGQG